MVHPPEPSLDQTRSWLARPVDGPPYDEMPLEYQADPARPWNAFEPRPPSRPALGQVAMPLPPRDGYVDPGPYSSYVPVSPGRADPDATEVMARVDEDRTEVIERVR